MHAGRRELGQHHCLTGRQRLDLVGMDEEALD
jgi:hypothetical protein